LAALQRKGEIKAGCDADLVVWNPEEAFEVRSERLLFRHKLTPYSGRRLFGVVQSTFLRGEVIYSDGKLIGRAQGHVLLDLATERVGGQVIAANDDFFAAKENLIKPAKPVWIEDRYTDRGKWMDGWESRRRRTPGHDWCILKLGLAGIISKVIVDTSYFRGNYPESCSIDATGLEPGEDPLANDVVWNQILSQSPLKGDAQNSFVIADPFRYTHLRLNIYPDGGVARLRVYGEAVPDWETLSNTANELDLAAIEHGGRILDCSDKFFSAPQNLLLLGRSTGMHDGWETRRRRGPGHDWVTIRLGVAGIISSVEVDTSHFKGNYPESCSLEACAIANESDADGQWSELLPRTKLDADSIRRFKTSCKCLATHLRFNMYPDGGVARLRIYGHPDAEALSQARLRWLNSLPQNAARKMFLNCCGSTKWCEAMLSQRPFASIQHLLDVAEHACDVLEAEDWKQAFAAHPQIGEKKIGAPEQAQRWSEAEQAGAAGASAEVQKRLQQRNQDYHSRFGYIFIVCASGQSGEAMLATLERRLHNDPPTEQKVAAGEQRKITKLRLQKLVNP
jgi:allantoicase